MADNISRIDPAKVIKAGDAIIDQGTKMYNALESIKGIVNNTKKCFRSEGGDAARENFNKSAEKFDDFKKFIEEYGEFLRSYAGAHIKLDSAVDDLARKIPNLG